MSTVPQHLKSKAAGANSVTKAARILGIDMFTEYERLMCTISGSHGAAGKSGSDKEKPKFDIHKMGLIQGMVNWLTGF